MVVEVELVGDEVHERDVRPVLAVAVRRGLRDEHREQLADRGDLVGVTAVPDQLDDVVHVPLAGVPRAHVVEAVLLHAGADLGRGAQRVGAAQRQHG
jgi:hypothetical protein